jgi:hypothetical protein
MKTLFLTLFLLLAASPSWALSLRWDAVTTDPTGVPLTPSLAVTQYRVYRCNVPSASCVLSGATLLGTVNAPTTMFSLTGQSFPATYFVTAVNIVQESLESLSIKVVGPDKPKNESLQTP